MLAQGSRLYNPQPRTAKLALPITDCTLTFLRQIVTWQAAGASEYCRIHTFSIYPCEVDHAIELKHGEQTMPENLVSSCLPCNRHKGSDLTSLAPLTGEIMPLFNPRIQAWSKHF